MLFRYSAGHQLLPATPHWKEHESAVEFGRIFPNSNHTINKKVIREALTLKVISIITLAMSLHKSRVSSILHALLVLFSS